MEYDQHEKTKWGCNAPDVGSRMLCTIKENHVAAVGCCDNGTRCNDFLTPMRVPNPSAGMDFFLLSRTH